MDDNLSQVFAFFDALRANFWQQPQKENLAALATNLILGVGSSVLFSLTFGTPRLHSTLKLWSETLTRLQWAITSYYIYLTITNKDNAVFVIAFGALSFTLVMFSAWFTRTITTDIHKSHECTFTSVSCPVTDRRHCAFPKPIILDRNQCNNPIRWWQFIRILLPNFGIALASLATALFTALYFTRK